MRIVGPSRRPTLRTVFNASKAAGISSSGAPALMNNLSAPECSRWKTNA